VARFQMDSLITAAARALAAGNPEHVEHAEGCRSDGHDVGILPDVLEDSRESDLRPEREEVYRSKH